MLPMKIGIGVSEDEDGDRIFGFSYHQEGAEKPTRQTRTSPYDARNLVEHLGSHWPLALKLDKAEMQRFPTQAELVEIGFYPKE